MKMGFFLRLLLSLLFSDCSLTSSAIRVNLGLISNSLTVTAREHLMKTITTRVQQPSDFIPSMFLFIVESKTNRIEFVNTKVLL